jgi:predicted small lipoprotein YifL
MIWPPCFKARRARSGRTNVLKTRLFAAGIGVVAAATLALAGCGDKTPDASPPPSSSVAQVPAKEALANALKKLDQQSSKVEQTMDGMFSMKSTGATDPVANKVDMSMEMSLSGTQFKVAIRSLGNDVWVKMIGIQGLSDKWMHVAADKVKKGSTLDPEKFSSSRLSEALVDVQRDGANGFKGTIDLTKSSTISEEALKQLGDKAKAVPFTATVDDQGRISQLTLDMNSLMQGMGMVKTTYSGYGEPVNVTAPPASEVVEMPAQLIDSMNKG